MRNWYPKIKQVLCECEGTGTVWVSDGGGNDPDVRKVPCEECDGDGMVDVIEEGSWLELMQKEERK